MATKLAAYLESLGLRTLTLIVQLLLDDLEPVQSHKDKGRENDISDVQQHTDHETAMSVAQTLTDMVAADQRLAQSIEAALNSDAEAIAKHLEEERMFESDRLLAQSLAGNVDQTLPANTVSLPVQAHPVPPPVEAQPVPLPVKATASGSVSKPQNGTLNEIVEASASTSEADPPETGRCCSFCFEEHRPTNLCKLPCNHEYCKECLQGLLERCTKDESLFPPRCCKKEIEPNEFNSWLQPELIAQIDAKRLEHNTADKTYCHQPTCSTFIPPQTITYGMAICPKCGLKTCHKCKAAGHNGDCPTEESLETQQMLEFAREKGWQRCPSCSMMIELGVGCYHMTCRCKMEFCYLCARQWKTCACEQWEETQLLERATEVACRGMDDDVPANAQQVQQTQERLRQNHDCDHDEGWRKVDGRHRCDLCRDMLPNFIFRCGQCTVQVCWNCRMNRV